MHVGAKLLFPSVKKFTSRAEPQKGRPEFGGSEGVEKEMTWRRDAWYSGKRMLGMELTGKRKVETPKRRFVDMVRADMWEVAVTEGCSNDKKIWQRIMHGGDP